MMGVSGRHARTWVAALACALACGPACDSAVGGGVSVDAFAPRLAAAFCDKVFACCTADEIGAANAGFTSRDECTSFTEALVSGFLTTPAQAAVTGGRAGWRAAEAEVCLQTIEAAGCTELEEPAVGALLDLTGCETIIEPRLDAGATCAEDFECTTGYCEEGGAPEGTCRGLPTVGQPCPDFTCETGAWCEAGTCARLRATGEACSSAEACASGSCVGTGDDRTCGAPPDACGGA